MPRTRTLGSRARRSCLHSRQRAATSSRRRTQRNSATNPQDRTWSRSARPRRVTSRRFRSALTATSMQSTVADAISVVSQSGATVPSTTVYDADTRTATVTIANAPVRRAHPRYRHHARRLRRQALAQSFTGSGRSRLLSAALRECSRCSVACTGMRIVPSAAVQGSSALDTQRAVRATHRRLHARARCASGRSVTIAAQYMAMPSKRTTSCTGTSSQPSACCGSGRARQRVRNGEVIPRTSCNASTSADSCSGACRHPR